jgi:RNA polymerase sigma-70 factor (ECF subfamily)
MAMRMVADAGVAEDLVQEALIRAYRKRGFYDPERALEPWLYRTAMNVFLNAVASRRPRETPLDGLPAAEMAAAAARDPAAVRDDAERVRRLLLDLPPEHRAVIALRYTEDLPIESIAEILGRPIGTVKTILFRSREFLRSRLEERDDR